MQKRREVPKWVSHNKVLIGSGDGINKKPHARNPNFDSEETRLLIQLWGNKDVQRQLITIHKKHPVIAKIAEKMRAYGYNRSTEEINTRIKNLKCLYNRIKKDLDSGLLNEPSWKHYYAMDEILSRPVFGNSATSSKLPMVNKIIISPSSTSISDDQQMPMFHVKEEDLSDEENGVNNIEFEELRPEDLLSVIETENDNDIQIKEEPMDVVTITETKLKEKPDDAQTDDSIHIDDESNKTSTNPSLNKSSIINYGKETLSISSVHSSHSQAIVQSSSSTNQSGSKISLVPTKLLLKPQATVNGFKSVSQVVTSSVNSSVQTTSSSIPMKVVFVNALSKNSNAQQTVTKQQISLNKSLTQIQGANSSFIANLSASQQQPQKIQLVNSQITPNLTNSVTSQKPNTNNTSTNNNHLSGGKSSKSLLGSSKLPVIRNLLTNIVEIENQRLEIEKQRFEYEKKVGNELLSLLKTFVQSKTTSEKNDQLNEANAE